MLHIHGNRLIPEDMFIIGHDNYRDASIPYDDEWQLPPYQNADSEVIRIMNDWTKKTESIINHHKPFFMSLDECKAVCVMGLSYNDIDMPYLKKVVDSVSNDNKWWLYYYEKIDMEKAQAAAKLLGLKDYYLRPLY